MPPCPPPHLHSVQVADCVISRRHHSVQVVDQFYPTCHTEWQQVIKKHFNSILLLKRYCNLNACFMQ